jgi:hypothetical protein
MPLMEVPAQIVRYALENVWGETDPALYDQPSWDETEAAQQAVIDSGFRWAVRLTSTSMTEFQRQVALTTNADLYQSGGLWVYKWRKRRDPAATLTPATMTQRPVFSRIPPRTSLTARFTASWDPNYVTDEWRQAKVYQSTNTAQLDASQLGRNRYTDRPNGLQMPYVADTPTADWIARHALTKLDRQRWAVTVTSDWDAIALEKGDTIALASPVLTAALGTSTGHFVVTRKAYDFATDAIVLTAEEADAPAVELQLTWAIRATLSQALSLTWDVNPRMTLPLSWNIGFRLTRALNWKILHESAALSGTPVATATGAGALTLGPLFAGTAQGMVTLTGGLTTPGFVGATTGTATLTATFYTPGAALLGGSVAASATVIGGLSIAVRLAGALIASALASGALAGFVGSGELLTMEGE